MKYFTLERVAFFLVILSLLISLGYCGSSFKGEHRKWVQEKKIGDSVSKLTKSLLLKAQSDLLYYKERESKYHRVIDSSSKEIYKYKKSLDWGKNEIRSLYQLLSSPTLNDTVEVASKCCEVANAMTYTIDSLQIADSTKDAQYAGMLDLATAQIDSMAKTIEASARNFRVVDSLRRIAMRESKPRGKISAGVAGGFAPGFGWGGAVIRYEGPGGVGYEIEAGPSTGGMYYGGRITRKISLRKKR